MSYHTMQYLNSGNILVGNIEKTGKAWWYDQRLEDPSSPTHFEGFIPLATVKKRLFGWEALESTKLEAVFEVPALDLLGNPIMEVLGINDDGSENYGDQRTLIKRVLVKSFKALGREDWLRDGIPEGEEDGADAVLSVTGETYGVHQMKEMFITNVAQILGGADNIGVQSGGLLKWGRRGWITVSIPNNLHNDVSGMDFRPNLTVSTSFDQSLPTSFTRTIGIPVCDNTLDWELAKAGEDNGKFVIRHTSKSLSRVKDAAEALGLMMHDAEKMDAVLTEFAQTDVSEKQFLKLLDSLVPIPEVKVTEKIVSIQGEDKITHKVSTNSQTIAMNKRDKLVEMWDRDPRVSPWKGTKLGVIQLFNTFNTHEGTIKGAKSLGGNKIQARVEGNMMKALKGDFAKSDAKVQEAIDAILAEDGPVLVSAGVTLPLSDLPPKAAVAAPKKPRTPRSKAAGTS